MRPVKMFLGLIAGLVIVMFIAKVLLFAILFALPAMLLFFAFRGLRHSRMERGYGYYETGYRQHLDPSWQRLRHEPLVPEQEKPFDWLMDSRTIQVQ